MKNNLKRAIIIALIVGTLLAVINHYDMFLNRDYKINRFIQITLTYLVPFFVSLFSSAKYCEFVEKKKLSNS